MMARLTFLGHSCFEIVTDEHTLLIDPFLTGNPVANRTADDCSPDFILLTHGHADHVGDAVAIAQRTGATVLANYEISEWLTRQGVKSHGMQMGGEFSFPFGRVKMTIAFHGSQLPDGSEGGNPAGFLIKLPTGTIYHAGDTALFSDMRLYGEEGIDVAILPIGDNYTMGPGDAVRATKFLEPRQVVPCHFNTWPPIAQDAQAWAHEVRTQTTAEPVVLAVGDSLELSS
ncbi:MAG: metal-dependent hydrolase [Planctomycetaceae bacterium]|nr:metal-dependent hydrolase [Planctomycetaceae bacterium]